MAKVKAPDWEHRLDCHDAMGRPSQLVVSVYGRELVVQVPPGESAVFTGCSADQLRRALVLAIDHIARRPRF